MAGYPRPRSARLSPPRQPPSSEHTSAPCVERFPRPGPRVTLEPHGSADKVSVSDTGRARRNGRDGPGWNRTTARSFEG
jgi:hypothetical protein